VRTLTILDFLRTSFGEDLKLRMRIPLDVILGCVPCLCFFDLNESRGLDVCIYIYIYIYTRTCIKFTRFQFTDALEDEKSGSHLSYLKSTPNMGYWALKLFLLVPPMALP